MPGHGRGHLKADAEASKAIRKQKKATTTRRAEEFHVLCDSQRNVKHPVNYQVWHTKRKWVRKRKTQEKRVQRVES